MYWGAVTPKVSSETYKMCTKSYEYMDFDAFAVELELDDDATATGSARRSAIWFASKVALSGTWTTQPSSL